jgi:hypothetical protein
MSDCCQEDKRLLKECYNQIEDEKINKISEECDCFINELRNIIEERCKDHGSIKFRYIKFDEGGKYKDCEPRNDTKKNQNKKDQKKLDRIIKVEIEKHEQGESKVICVGVECKKIKKDIHEKLIENIKDKFNDFFNDDCNDHLDSTHPPQEDKFCLIYIIINNKQEINRPSVTSRTIEKIHKRLESRFSKSPFKNNVAIRIKDGVESTLKGRSIEWKDLCSNLGEK